MYNHEVKEVIYKIEEFQFKKVTLGESSLVVKTECTIKLYWGLPLPQVPSEISSVMVVFCWLNLAYPNDNGYILARLEENV